MQGLKRTSNVQNHKKIGCTLEAIWDRFKTQLQIIRLNEPQKLHEQSTRKPYRSIGHETTTWNSHFDIKNTLIPIRYYDEVLSHCSQFETGIFLLVINTTRDILRIVQIISRTVRRNNRSGIYARYHVQIMLLFVYITAREVYVTPCVIFTCRYFYLKAKINLISTSKISEMPFY